MMYPSNIRCALRCLNYDCLFTLHLSRRNVTAKPKRVRESIFNNHVSRRQLSRYSASTIMSQHLNEFRINDYDIIGFDLDGTLLRYNLNEMVPLQYEILREYLVKVKGYPNALLDKPFESDFLQKGLLLDTEKGNLLKLGSDGTILRATHGTKALTSEDIVKIYGTCRRWEVADQFLKDPLSTWNGPLADKMRTLLDYFDVMVSLVFAQIVDILDDLSHSNGYTEQTIYKIWPDILAGLIHMYTREHFANGQSAYFEALRMQPERFLLRTSQRVVNWLKELRAMGKSTYLLTGSNIDFANLTASYALGPNWQDLFDSVICFAKKPGFFNAQRQYLRVADFTEVPGSEINLAEELSLDSIYSQGNYSQLVRALCRKLDKNPNSVRALYFGDNLVQDIYTPTTQCNVDTIAISEELFTDGDISSNNYEFQQVVGSSVWGSYFCVDDKPTLWSAIIENYSKLCISHMDIFAEVPVQQTLLCDNKHRCSAKVPDNLVA